MTRTVAERNDVLPALAEVFREHGYEGATLSIITEKTGLGKGSLYHFFPGGKAEMAEAVLDEIGGWFEASIFTPLAEADSPSGSLSRMFEKTDAYFASGKRICLVGAFALSDTRDRFAIRLRDYFLRWREALELALRRAGLGGGAARTCRKTSSSGYRGRWSWQGHSMTRACSGDRWRDPDGTYATR